MSGYKVKAKFPHHEIFMGWDPPLSTYFIHVINTIINEDDPGHDVYWVGCNVGEIETIEVLLTSAAPYINLTAIETGNLKEKLVYDRRFQK